MDLTTRLGLKKPGARGTHPSSEELRDALRDNADLLDSYPPLVTALTPGAQGIPNPVTDGFEVRYLADAANGIIWPLRYRAASSSAYKWEVVGSAPPLHANTNTSGSGGAGTNNSYGAIGGVPPSVTVPLAGDYMVEHGCELFAEWSGAASWVMQSFDVGATAASDLDAVRLYNADGGIQSASVSRLVKKPALAAATALTCKYKSSWSQGTTLAEFRWIAASPVRVG